VGQRSICGSALNFLQPSPFWTLAQLRTLGARADVPDVVIRDQAGGGARPYGGLRAATSAPKRAIGPGPRVAQWAQVGGSQIDLTFAIDQGSHNGHPYSSWRRNEMDTSSTYHHPRPVGLWRAALIGATIITVLCFVFWATAVANALPAGMPEPIRTFTPAAGVARLVAGLFWTGLIGAIFAAVLAGIYNLARRELRSRPIQ